MEIRANVTQQVISGINQHQSMKRRPVLAVELLPQARGPDHDACCPLDLLAWATHEDPISFDWTQEPSCLNAPILLLLVLWLLLLFAPILVILWLQRPHTVRFKVLIHRSVAESRSHGSPARGAGKIAITIFLLVSLGNGGLQESRWIVDSFDARWNLWLAFVPYFWLGEPWDLVFELLLWNLRLWWLWLWVGIVNQFLLFWFYDCGDHRLVFLFFFGYSIQYYMTCSLSSTVYAWFNW